MAFVEEPFSLDSTGPTGSKQCSRGGDIQRQTCCSNRSDSPGVPGTEATFTILGGLLQSTIEETGTLPNRLCVAWCRGPGGEAHRDISIPTAELLLGLAIAIAHWSALIIIVIRARQRGSFDRRSNVAQWASSSYWLSGWTTMQTLAAAARGGNSVA